LRLVVRWPQPWPSIASLVNSTTTPSLGEDPVYLR
jgi:hypothetical protein